MRIYFSGIGGVGLGPLAEIARDAGATVFGSDATEGLVTRELRAAGVSIDTAQDGGFLRAVHEDQPIDWFVYTAALPEGHPEMRIARELGLRIGKRDEFLAEFIRQHGFRLLAVSGTHGKTTTTGMLIWALKELGVPISYSIGTTLSFGPSGAFDPGSTLFVYECDEFDRNFLSFHPALSLLPSIDYDHPDTYPTEELYTAAFRQYIAQSEHTIAWQRDLDYLGEPSGERVQGLAAAEVAALGLAGAHNRQNATLVLAALQHLGLGDAARNHAALASFPGTDRRFERLAENLYSDYGHHPEEIAATLQLARELSDRVVLVYQPHQNWRQHFIREQYTNQFELAEKVFWLPTYLTRENAEQPLLHPQDLVTGLTNRDAVHIAALDDALWREIEVARADGALVLAMGAGTIDEWVRERLR